MDHLSGRIIRPSSHLIRFNLAPNSLTMSFGQRVIQFHQELNIPQIQLPEGFSWLYPYNQSETLRVMEAYYHKYYPDAQTRTFLFGINPGRLGAGITGVPFTDPVRLEADCGIANTFEKKQELSAQFVWSFIRAFGGPELFCSKFYITSISPLGFIKDGININYYDDRQLIKAVEPFAVWNIRTQLDMGGNREFFQEIIPLPHPRWVMQYRRKRMEEFIETYLIALHKTLAK
jgi:hypothetical protein